MIARSGDLHWLKIIDGRFGSLIDRLAEILLLFSRPLWGCQPRICLIQPCLHGSLTLAEQCLKTALFWHVPCDSQYCNVLIFNALQHGSRQGSSCCAVPAESRPQPSVVQAAVENALLIDGKRHMTRLHCESLSRAFRFTPRCANFRAQNSFRGAVSG